jgi:competence protein ComEA
MRALFLLLTIVALAAIPAAAQESPKTEKLAPGAKAEKPAAAAKGEKPTAAAKTDPPASAAKADKPGRAGALVNLNTATQAQLETLPGVGAKAAERILEYRQKNGQFKKVEDLMNVKGIGEKSFLKLKPLLTVTDKDKASGAQDR